MHIQIHVSLVSGAILTIPACSNRSGVSVENEKFCWDLVLQTFKAIGVANKFTGDYTSLGIWLSPASSNSKIGKERRQEGFVMDICRGSLMARIWTHPKWLITHEREDLAHFVGLLRTYLECFRNRRFILGNP